MNKNTLHVGVVGAGAISDIYLENMIHKFDILCVDKICAVHLEHAQAKAEKYGITACTLEEMLADETIDMIVNLTPVDAHYDIIKRALLAGKHVYTEKTMTDNFESASELMALSEEKHLYLGCAPDTFLGGALQTARDMIDSGQLGDINSFAIACNRDNNILDSLFAFHRLPGSGLANNYAVYHITALVSLLGSVKRTAAIVKCPYPKKINILPTSPEFGQEMDTPNESRISAVLELENGVSGTFHGDCDSVLTDQAYFAVFGQNGILYLTDPNQFGGEVKFLPKSTDPRNPEPPRVLENRFGYNENSRGLGPALMAEAILSGSKNRTDKSLAGHVAEVLNAILESGRTNRFVEVHSTCERPEAMEKVR